MYHSFDFGCNMFQCLHININRGNNLNVHTDTQSQQRVPFKYRLRVVRVSQLLLLLLPRPTFITNPHAEHHITPLNSVPLINEHEHCQDSSMTFIPYKGSSVKVYRRTEFHWQKLYHHRSHRYSILYDNFFISNMSVFVYFFKS